MKRPADMSFEDYKKAQRNHNKSLRQYLRGRIFFAGGTYDAGRNEEKRQKKTKKQRRKERAK